MADYTDNYRIINNAASISTRSAYFYHVDADSDGVVDTGELKRATEAGVTGDHLVKQINTYRGASTATADIKSITYNNVRKSGDTVDRLKGEEVADYTYNYTSWGTIATTTLYLYNGAIASLASSDAPLSQINTYRGISSTNIKSITFNHIANRYKGEEVADYTYNYKDNGGVTSTSTYFYHVDSDSDGIVDTGELKRATEAGVTGDHLVKQINTYRGASTATADLKSITYNNVRKAGDTVDRLKSEEVADYTVNYITLSTTPATRTVYFYGTSLNRASSASADH